jgi:RimJ/RimL family protein N-acetyltransferase
MVVRTYGFPGCFTRPTGDLDSQLPTRNVHVEACRPRVFCINPSFESMLLTAQPLSSERLELEPLGVEHAPEMVVVLADPALYRFIGGRPPSEAELVARYVRQTRRPGWLNWLLRRTDTGEAIGTVQATQRDEHTAEVAWVVSSSFQGAGYATEAAAAAIRWLEARGIEVFEAYIHPDHIASNKVAERLGFVPTESIRDGETGWKRKTRCQN